MKTLVFCAALPQEIAALCQTFHLNLPSKRLPFTGPIETADCRVYALVSGIGAWRMAQALSVLSLNEVDCWVSIGVAGALDAAHQPERCYLGGTVVTPHGEPLSFENDALKQQVDPGVLLCVDRPAVDAAAKRDLHWNTGAVLVDMESIAVARHAQSRGGGFLWIKAVLDGADESLPLDLLNTLNEHGFPSIKKALAVLARRPTRLPQMIQLGRRTQKASRCLAQCVLDWLQKLDAED